MATSRLMHARASVTVTLAGALIALVAAVPLAAPARAVDPLVGASIVGAHVDPVSGQTSRQAVEALETQLGAPVPLVSEYLAWNASFPTAYHSWLRDSGHDLVLLVKLKRSDGSRPKWADLANAQPGSSLYNDMVRWANGFKAYGAPVYFVFHKEPNESANQTNGTATDYKAAWARFVTFMREQGVTNAQYVFAMAGSIYGKSTNGPDTWYPGDAYVDIIASTGVNSCSGSTCTYRQQASIMAPMVKWAAGHPTKRIAVAEGGTVESTIDNARKATWIDNARTTLAGTGYENLEFYSYRHYGNYRLDTSTGSLGAARTWFSDPYWTS